MMAASFVALVESTGAFIAVSRYASATPMAHSVLSRGVGWQGIGILFCGIFGTGIGSSVAVQIWSCLCFNSIPNCCSYVLPIFCICWYVKSHYVAAFYNNEPVLIGGYCPGRTKMERPSLIPPYYSVSSPPIASPPNTHFPGPSRVLFIEQVAPGVLSYYL